MAIGLNLAEFLLQYEKTYLREMRYCLQWSSMGFWQWIRQVFGYPTVNCG